MYIFTKNKKMINYNYAKFRVLCLHIFCCISKQKECINRFYIQLVNKII